jgi:phage terminase large subunit-like protein
VVVPSGLVSTGWPAVRDKSAELGIRFDEWQDGAGRLILAKRADGSYATSIGGVVISIPRQVGKTFLVGWVVFSLCLLFPGLTVIWTAHRLRTAAETFASMEAMTRRRKVAVHIRSVVRGSGDEAIVFRNGSRILFGARERGFGRGFTLVDVLVFDEAQILTDNAIDDMVPATNQAPNPLLLFTGTPPKVSDAGEVFRDKRARALSGQSDDMAYIEFSADEDADPDDREQWAKANPSYPRRTPELAMLRMRENLTDESFMREALGIWDSTGGSRVIDAESWKVVADQASMAVDRLALGISVAPDRSVASVALGGFRFDGLGHVELDEHRSGTGWVVPWVKARCERNTIRAVVIDAMSPATSLLEEFTKAKIKVTVTTGGEYASACGQFFDGVMNAGFRHTDQPQVNVALSVVGKRPLGSAWVWNKKKTDADITPVDAETLALWGAQSGQVKKPTRSATKGRRATVL